MKIIIMFIAMFLLVSSMSPHNHLLHKFSRFCGGSSAKTGNKNRQRILPGFITIPSITYIVCTVKRFRLSFILYVLTLSASTPSTTWVLVQLHFYVMINVVNYHF